MVGTGVGAKVEVAVGGSGVLVGGRGVEVGGRGVAVGAGGGSVGVAVGRKTRRVADGETGGSVGSWARVLRKAAGVGVRGWFGQGPGPVMPLL